MLKLSNNIMVVGSLNPTKNCQDRVRILNVDGLCYYLRATDFKDPPKVFLVGK